MGYLVKLWKRRYNIFNRLRGCLENVFKTIKKLIVHIDAVMFWQSCDGVLYGYVFLTTRDSTGL